MLIDKSRFWKVYILEDTHRVNIQNRYMFLSSSQIKQVNIYI